MIKYNYNSLDVKLKAERYDISITQARKMIIKECVERAILELNDEDIKEILLFFLKNIEVK